MKLNNAIMESVAKAIGEEAEKEIKTPHPNSRKAAAITGQAMRVNKIVKQKQNF